MSALDGSGGSAFKSRLMPENKDKSQDRPISAPKKPGAAPKADAKVEKGPKKGADREARLAEALRANLRRRKAPKSGDSGDEDTKEE